MLGTRCKEQLRWSGNRDHPHGAHRAEIIGICEALWLESTGAVGNGFPQGASATPVGGALQKEATWGKELSSVFSLCGSIPGCAARPIIKGLPAVLNRAVLPPGPRFSCERS